MLPIALGLLIWCPAIIGWGIITRRVSGRAIARDGIDLSDAPAGYLALTILAITANYYLPLGRGVAAFTALVGWSVLVAAFRRASVPALLRSAAPAAAILLVVAFAAAQPVHYGYDAGLYHLQTMQWVEQSRVPLGLANLNGRLGYNSAWLSLATLVRDPFDAHFLDHAILLPATMLIFCALAVLRGVPLARTSVGAATAVIGALAVASPTVYLVVNSTAQDVVPLVAWLACTALVVRAAEHPGESDLRLDDAWRIAAVAVTAKLSAFTIVLLPLAATLLAPAAMAAPGTGTPGAPRMRRLLRFAWLPALAVFCWSLRGVALSGCAAYPAGPTCVHSLAWTVTAASTKTESQSIAGWARQPFVPPEQIAPFPEWVPAWFARVSRDPDVQLPVALVVASLIAMLVARPGVPPSRAPRGTRTVFATIGLALVAWLILAPDPRFGAGPLWSLGALAAAIAAGRALSGGRGWRVWLAPAVVLAVWLPHAARMARALSRPVRNPGLAAVFGAHRVRIVSPLAVRAALTAAGDTVWVPANPLDDRCGLAPLPCAPAVPPGLVVVRDADGTIAGFRTQPPRP